MKARVLSPTPLARPAFLPSLLAAAVVAVAGAGCGGSASSGTATTGAAPAPPAAVPPRLSGAVALVRRELRGIPQRGLVLGRATAPVTIVEYADLTCGACARVHTQVVPQVISRFVRSGRASLELRVVASGARSTRLAVGAHAASAQRRGWDFVQLAYLRAAAAAGGPPESPARLAEALGLDLDGWRSSLEQRRWAVLIAAAESVVRVGRFTGDPVFLVRRRGNNGPFVVVTQPRSAADVAAAVARARRA